jgi:hypothetical protein
LSRRPYLYIVFYLIKPGENKQFNQSDSNCFQLKSFQIFSNSISIQQRYAGMNSNWYFLRKLNLQFFGDLGIFFSLKWNNFELPNMVTLGWFAFLSWTEKKGSKKEIKKEVKKKKCLDYLTQAEVCYSI